MQNTIGKRDSEEQRKRLFQSCIEFSAKLPRLCKGIFSGEFCVRTVSCLEVNLIESRANQGFYNKPTIDVVVINVMAALYAHRLQKRHSVLSRFLNLHDIKNRFAF